MTNREQVYAAVGEQDPFKVSPAVIARQANVKPPLAQRWISVLRGVEEFERDGRLHRMSDEYRVLEAIAGLPRPLGQAGITKWLGISSARVFVACHILRELNMVAFEDRKHYGIKLTKLGLEQLPKENM